MHDLAKDLPPPLMKGDSAMADNWSVHIKEFTVSDIRLDIKGGLTKFMGDKSDDHPEDYCFLTYKDWCYLPSTIEV